MDGLFLTVDILGATKLFSPHQDEWFEKISICKKTVPMGKRFTPCDQTTERTPSRGTNTLFIHFMTNTFFGIKIFMHFLLAIADLTHPR